MTTNDALDEASELRKLLHQQIRNNEALAKENAMLRRAVYVVLFDIDKAGRVSTATENVLRLIDKETKA